MKLIFHYMKGFTGAIILSMLFKLISTFFELALPYILEHMIDDVVPQGDMKLIVIWGIAMLVTALACWIFNVTANHKAVDNSHRISFKLRKDLFDHTVNLSGKQFDSFGLPSLTARMTSDSYNVQSFVHSFQTMCVRAPIMLLGGMAITMTIDPVLSSILCITAPVMIFIVLGVSIRGIPLYNRVQNCLDDITRVLRENITGIRVIKALSKTEYETDRFRTYNDRITDEDMKANGFMAIPGPTMQLCLNIGLTLVVFIGANRVNAGVMKPGVILAFLTYFNLIMMSVMALNRIFIMMSKASASANRIALVLAVPDEPVVVTDTKKDESDAFIHFDHVTFAYNTQKSNQEMKNCLNDIDFEIPKGGTMGIIGPTGCGKTTIINLLMRFYDADEGAVYINGRDVRSYDKDELHRMFGVVFQNDIIFNDTLAANIRFGRDITDEQMDEAIRDAQAYEYISKLDEGLEYKADIKGANLSGGQKQRLLIARALAGHPQILVLDDSSSALDYRTDANLRKAITENHSDSTLIMIAQRVSSIQNADQILVLDDGYCIGHGTHEQLLESCEYYRNIYESQMGELEQG
ncbi:MAG: ABC transporter ATP-binding protein [Bulleidia sp.]